MKKIPRRNFLQLAASTAAAPVISRPAFAQSYPTRPIKLVVAFPAGGTTDLLARILAQPLSERLGQQVVIENKPGGGTNIAIQSVVNAPPDGYTLAMTFATNTINPSLYKSLPFDFQRDIAPVSGLADLPLVLVVNKDVPAKDVNGFVGYAKANPGKITFASFGARTISHLAIELLRMNTGIEFVHVPYPGGPQIITDLVSGRIQAGMDALPNSLPHIRAGAVRALAVMSPQRNPAVPDVPAIRETIPGIEINAGTGIGVPAATPVEIIERLNRDINASLADPALKARYADVGAVPMIFMPAEARAKIASDTEKWRKVIESAGLKPE
ncbi:MAG: tripartite tricarboxylate transporter substrate binding protein [Xanthobacteraceae bacterium]|nr:tripartite tricarboxylate transporter substrate binding protein [Xanthobacteraceae bacterium]